MLLAEDKLNYLEHLIPIAHVPAFTGQQVHLEALVAHAAWVKGQKEIELKILFSQQAEHELLQIVREFHICKQEEGQSIGSYFLKMKSYIDNLEHLGHPMSLNLATVNELHAMLKLHKQTLQKKYAPVLHAIRACKVHKKNKNKKPQLAVRGNNQGKGKYKLAYAPKPKIPPSPKKENPAKDSNSFLFLENLGYMTRVVGLTSVILLRDSKGSMKLKPGALSLYMGNGQCAAVKAIGSYDLCFPSGLVIILHNCHYAPFITKGVILVSRLYDDGFINHFDGNTISVSRNNVIYFSVVLKDGIYEIDLSNSNTNNSSMYVVSNKRAKLNLDSTLLWHCRLRHISKKRIEKLQHDGLLNSTNIKSFEKCVSCMSGKMARKPYLHQVERAKDLLGLIHTNLKHKHEVFETFKVFQKEVENQLEKTIKSLRSDCGGEYMSQEFLDHLKEHGIITYHTPPYTPQHNGVSERRNRALLDMVRSMMNQTTLPKSFWDSALESAARILNMVLTKKALVKRDTLTRPNKLEPRSIKCMFVGYPKETIGYSFYYPPENKVFVAQNDEFLKDDLITQEASRSLEDLEIIQEQDTHPSENTSVHHDERNQEIDKPQSDIIPIRRSTKTRHAPNRMCLYIDDAEYKLGDLNELDNYKAALLDPESNKWLEAMNVEMQFMKNNDVWDLVDLPPDEKTVGSKWIFKKKTDMDGAVHTYKARLVAKGFTQTYGVDYEETFSPVADVRAIRILIAIAAFYDYEI
ncbi:retrotransposon protein, putative, ty1-copia subclass [Tanacetum coccineum]